MPSGGTIAASDRRLVPGREEGPDHDSMLQSRILDAIHENYVVICVFFRVLVVSCTPTTQYSCSFQTLQVRFR